MHAAFRAELNRWLDDHAASLRPPFAGSGALAQQVAQLNRVKAALFDAGWMQHGWPERIGGSGGPASLRAIVGQCITERALVHPGFFSMTEILVPTLLDFAPPQVAASYVPRLLSGEEMWCQGFSEPNAGSDLAALSCRAVQDGDRFIINGQKLWTSLSQFASRALLLSRTGTSESRHRGITAFFVDLDSPGITIRPIGIISGDDEFAEVFLDDVSVPADRVIGEVNGGWKVAMNVLPFERSTSFWYRIAFLYTRFEALVDEVEPDAHAETVIGEVYQALHAVRARSSRTIARFDAGEPLGAETSIDKVLMATAEQKLFDAVRELLPGRIELGDGVIDRQWREQYLYSRAATVYGGTAEIQRNIIAKRLLELGDD